MKATSEAVIASAGEAQAGNKAWWTQNTMSYDCMEFYINFGLPGIVFGFLGLGWLIGFLDLRAASAEWRGDLRSVFVYFLPAIAVIQPGASVVEISGSAGAAFLVAFGWRWLWTMRTGRQPASGRATLRRLPRSETGPVA